MLGWSLSDGVASQDLTGSGSVTSPTAGTTLTSISLGNGIYTIEWTFELSGTVSATDVNNVSVFIGPTGISQSVNLGAVGNYPQANIQAVVSGGPLTLAFKALATATSGATYGIVANAIPTGQSQATISDGSQPLAYVSIAPESTDNHNLTRPGLAVHTQLQIQATQGNISGVLFYALPDPQYGWNDGVPREGY